jgi:WD40 repeat protein
VLACSTGDFFVRFWRSSTKSRLFDVLMSDREVHCLRFSADGAFLAGVSSGGVVRVWDVGQRQDISRFAVVVGPNGELPVLAWSPDGSKIAAFDEAVQVWDLERGAHAFTLEQPPRSEIDSIQWSLASNELVCRGSHMHRPLVVDCSSGRVAWSIEQPGTEEEHGSPFAVQPGDPSYAPLAEDEARSMPEESFDACVTRRHPRGECAATGHGDGRLSLVDTTTCEVKSTLHGHADRVCLIAWSHDGSRLASVDVSGVLCIWDAACPCLLLTITATRDAALARTPGGYCEILNGTASEYRLAHAPELCSHARIYVPLGGLQEVLHRPEKVAAALRGDLSGDDASVELAGYGDLSSPVE